MCKSRIKPAVAPGVVASNRISSLQLHCGLCRCRVKKKKCQLLFCCVDFHDLFFKLSIKAASKFSRLLTFRLTRFAGAFAESWPVFRFVQTPSSSSPRGPSSGPHADFQGVHSMNYSSVQYGLEHCRTLYETIKQ